VQALGRGEKKKWGRKEFWKEPYLYKKGTFCPMSQKKCNPTCVGGGEGGKEKVKREAMWALKSLIRQTGREAEERGGRKS